MLPTTVSMIAAVMIERNRERRVKLGAISHRIRPAPSTGSGHDNLHHVVAVVLSAAL